MNETLKAKLIELGLTEEQIAKLGNEGVKEDADMQLISRDDMKSITGCGLVTASKVVGAFAPAPVVEDIAKSTPSPAVAFSGALDILPVVPNDESWLASLRAGGALKVDQSTVISAIRAALAYRAGLYGITDKLVQRMEAFADENDETVPPEFFKLRKQLTRRNYADIFEAIDGLDGNFVTETRKKELFKRIDSNLWPTIESFNEQLKNWVEAWQQGAANPAMLASSIVTMMSGGGKAIMPPGMMAPPDSGVLRDAADELNDNINKVFSGVGVQIASALAYDASKIKEMLENPQLPLLVGAANRDQMLRMLGVEVSATYPRMETNLTKFVLGVMKIKDIAAGDEELQYFGSLYMLGSQIPWGKLAGGAEMSGVAGIGRARKQL